ncbi:hypothetical protein MMC25_001222 [Agyrium rufum]|nr:hypothetical protein [Agyrium rufum]
MVLKPINTSIDIDLNGNMKITGAVRLLTPLTSPTTKMPILWTTRSGKPMFPVQATYNPITDVGGGIYGNSFFYRYSISTPSTTGISSFGPANQFRVQDSIFWVQSMSSSTAFNIRLGNPRLPVTANVTAAVLTSFAPTSVTALFSLPNFRPGTINRVVDQQSITMQKVGQAGAYTLYQSMVSTIDIVAFQASFDLVATNAQGQTVESIFNKLIRILPA